MTKPNSNKPELDSQNKIRLDEKRTQKRQKAKTVLLLGFGDVNQRLARLLLAQNAIIYAARRSPLPVTAEDLSDRIQFIQADITDSVQLSGLITTRPDQVVITIAPSHYSEQGYRDSYLKAVETLIKVCNQLNVQPEVLFVSSSSVYGHNKGELVNEESECLPLRHNGQVLLEAETALSTSPLKTTVVRFAGIYGSGRHRLIGVCLKQEADSQQQQVHWTNRINAEDCARVIEHLLALPANEREPLYLASDNLPVERHKVYNWIREQFQLAKLNEPVEPSQDVSVTGKRCDNSKLLESGFHFTYPTYQEGFIPVITEYKTQQ